MNIFANLHSLIKPAESTPELKLAWFRETLSEVRRRAGHRWHPLKEGTFDLPPVVCSYTSCVACGTFIHMYSDGTQIYFDSGSDEVQSFRERLLFGYPFPSDWRPKVCDKLATFA